MMWQLWKSDTTTTYGCLFQLIFAVGICLVSFSDLIHKIGGVFLVWPLKSLLG
jgi:hypothetical protein